MNVSLHPDVQRFIAEQVASGQYPTAEAVIQAGLLALRQHETFGDFAKGELDELIAEGERSIDEGGTADADEALTARRARRTAARNKSE